MRLVVISCLLFAACTGPAGPQGPAGDTSTLAAKVSLLEMQVAELRAALGGGMDGGAVERVRVPHLIVKATGEDLGPFVDWGHAYSKQFGGYYQLNGAQRVFTATNCTGAAYLADFAGGPVVDSTGEIVEASSAPLRQIEIGSALNGASCDPIATMMMCGTFSPTGIRAVPHPARDLTVELR